MQSLGRATHCDPGGFFEDIGTRAHQNEGDDERAAAEVNEEVAENSENDEEEEEIDEEEVARLEAEKQASIENSFDNGITELESLCMNCHKHGLTRLMLTRVPHFREVVIMSFSCEECGFRSSEVQFGGEIQTQGVRYEVEIRNMEDMNRQLIKSDTTTVSIPALQFEIPPVTQRGVISTVEGILKKALADLQEDQAKRAEIDPETTAAIQNVLGELAMMTCGVKMPFTVVVEDPAGNSFVENLMAPHADPAMKVSHFNRSPAQDIAVGLQPTEEDRERGTVSQAKPDATNKAPMHDEGLAKLVFDSSASEAAKEIIRFPTDCHDCHHPGESLMCLTDIPHFKEVIIMAFNCDKCGFRTNEVKCGGAIPTYGEKLTLRIDGTNPKDFARDVLKSDSASLLIPELDMEMESGSLGGMYTTVEGLMKKIRNNLTENNPFFAGDSSTNHHGDKGDDSMRSKFDRFVARLGELCDSGGLVPFTLILDDPLANSFIYSDCSPNPDPNLSSETYTRTNDQNDSLGINDMMTENYATHTHTETTPGGMAAVPEEGEGGEGEGEEAPRPGTKATTGVGEDEIILSDKSTMNLAPNAAGGYLEKEALHMGGGAAAVLHRCKGCNSVGVGLVKADGFCDTCRNTGKMEEVLAAAAAAAAAADADAGVEAATAAVSAVEVDVEVKQCSVCKGRGVGLVKEDGMCNHCRRTTTEQ